MKHFVKAHMTINLHQVLNYELLVKIVFAITKCFGDEQEEASFWIFLLYHYITEIIGTIINWINPNYTQRRTLLVEALEEISCSIAFSAAF